ncbi:MAG: hypothetical protein V3U85_03375 [Hyphomicrobium sp.]|jgi:phage host-nuclease inhibitor protein Gam
MNRDQYVESLKNKLDEWNEQISKTESEMKDASAEAQARYEEQLAEMKKHAATAEEKFQALIKSQSDDWEKHRANFETAWGDIAAGFGRAWSRFH